MNNENSYLMTDFSKCHQALKDLIQSVYNGTVIFEPANTSFEYALNQTKNKIKFPMISFYQENDIAIETTRNSFPSYTRGKLFESQIKLLDENLKDTGTTNERIGKSVQNLYITMKYIIDVYGTDRISTEKATQELLFWLFSNQQVDFKYMGTNLSFTFDISPTIVDNTDLVSYHSNGKLYRLSLMISVHTTLFRSVDYFNALHPEIEITVGTKES